MYDSGELKEYLKKFVNIMKKPEFSVFDYKFLKKSRVDDLLCCILAVMPENYKETAKKLRDADKKEYPSMLAYSMFITVVRANAPLSKDLYVVKDSAVNQLIKTMIDYFDRDLKKIERL